MLSTPSVVSTTVVVLLGVLGIVAVGLGFISGVGLANQAFHARRINIGVVLREAIASKVKLGILRIIGAGLVSSESLLGSWKTYSRLGRSHSMSAV